ncbi:unnamed protein product [Rangifer tarandus platyrhynchus]|uniref:Uncharacterized protein n=2 Tax=Rangifer tarandus platyrhynchus TaxID=3082113 RepID=A0ACB0FP71_RANTA|nr:unnamed protein product [Rangifer tarandus platyrhynchus]CAI9714194.1 unnamed protein product [Rangifer tarandus platyrhynchus]
MAQERGSPGPSSSSAAAPSASGTPLLSHQCQMERLERHIFGHLAGNTMDVPVIKLMSTQDPKPPFVVHVGPSVGCWERASSSRRRSGCCAHDTEQGSRHDIGSAF